uniref:C2H2-type domain-containing protein n=1 Tax=Caenorhabditis japonica TaxID=281687 RepID=A0A8R1IKH8_CAEJA
MPSNTDRKPIEKPVTFPCGECFSTFRAKTNLIRHRRNLHSLQHKCLLCEPVNGRLIDYMIISDHLEKEHGLIRAPRCMCCDHVFLNISSMNEHISNLNNRNCTLRQDKNIAALSKHFPGTLSREFVLTTGKLWNEIASNALFDMSKVGIHWEKNRGESAFDCCVRNIIRVVNCFGLPFEPITSFFGHWNLAGVAHVWVKEEVVDDGFDRDK